MLAPHPIAPHLLAAALVAGALAAPAAADPEDLTPVAQCTAGKANRVIPYGGWAYTTATTVPRRLTLVCTLDNGHDHFSGRQTAPGPVVAAAWSAAAAKPDSFKICTYALAEYAGFVTETEHCRWIGDPR